MWEHPVFEPDEEYCSAEDGGPDAFGYEAYFKEMQQKRDGSEATDDNHGLSSHSKF